MENKKRLIDVDELLAIGHETKMIEVLPEWQELPLSAQKAVCKHAGFMKKMIQQLPTVDAVEVVRCKDCKHYDNSEGIFWCHLNSKFYPGGFDWHSFPEDGFCCYGERKDNV